MRREVGGKFKREGTYVYLRLIHLDVWQKSTQYCKSIVLQLKINKYFKKKEIHMSGTHVQQSKTPHFQLRGSGFNPWAGK